jgi:hypothetical protein
VIGFVFPLFLRGPQAFVLSMIGTLIGLIVFCIDGGMRDFALIVVAFDFTMGMGKLIPWILDDLLNLGKLVFEF